MSAEDTPTTCIICMDDESSLTPIITTPCSHTYHRECLMRWAVVSNTCPTCRGVLAASANANPWDSMTLYERITNFLLLTIMSETYNTNPPLSQSRNYLTEVIHPGYFLT